MSKHLSSHPLDNAPKLKTSKTADRQYEVANEAELSQFVSANQPSSSPVTASQPTPVTTSPATNTQLRRSARLNNNEVAGITELMQVLSIAVTDTEPMNYKDSMTSPDRNHWVTAMNTEFTSLITHGTGKLVKLPPGKKPLPNRWVYRIKRDANNKTIKYKARLVVKGFMQKYGYDSGTPMHRQSECLPYY